jgi:protein-S-isoprenylcysteine O-methyltransferase Ste14
MQSTARKAAVLASVFTVLYIVLIPLVLLSVETTLSAIRVEVADLLGLLFLLPGAWLAISCVKRFAAEGFGTPAPFDPPKKMVACGPYRFVRNPMYVGVFLLILGEAVLFSSWYLFGYLLVLVTAAHLFVVFYEEPGLHLRFGEPYAQYCRQVNRWIPDPFLLQKIDPPRT